jgi:hypothetical protein
VWSLESEIDVRMSNLSFHINESQIVPSLNARSFLCTVEMYRSLFASTNAIFRSNACSTWFRFISLIGKVCSIV